MRGRLRVRALAGRGQGDAAYDPFADLLFTLVAAVLPAILVLLPAAHLAARRPEPKPDASGVEVGGQVAWPVVAGRDGLRLTGEGGRPVPLDAIPDSPELRAWLQHLRAGREPLLVIVEPDGLESAFALEPVLAAHGPPRFELVRAPVPCAGATDGRVRRACSAGSGTASQGPRP